MANNRLKKPQGLVVNGIDAGGMMTARISMGSDNIMKTPADGLSLPLKDKDTEFVRGQVATQDWPHALELLTAAAGTLVFYERESGKETFTKHTINKPVIHKVVLSFSKGQYGTATFDFECKPEDATEGIADMYVRLPAQVAPDYITAARGGYRIVSCVHGAGLDAINITHLTGFSFNLELPLTKESNDSDVGYTVCETEDDGMQAGGSIASQDGSVIMDLIAATRADLVVTAKQSQGAANKVVTIAGVDFDTLDINSDVGSVFTGHNINYDVSNDADTPLTLTGTNKLITIENAA